MNGLPATSLQLLRRRYTQPKTIMRRTVRVTYWLSTGLVSAVMVFSIINFNLEHPVGPRQASFAHLQLPDYFRIELTVAKILGVLALWFPGVPPKGRDFAYFGFGLTLVSASIAHFSSGDPILFSIDPLIFLGVLIVSYRSRRRLTATRLPESLG